MMVSPVGIFPMSLRILSGNGLLFFMCRILCSQLQLIFDKPVIATSGYY
jgi:hypothetical protein